MKFQSQRSSVVSPNRATTWVHGSLPARAEPPLQNEIAPGASRPLRRALNTLLAPLEAIALRSSNLVASHEARFEVAGMHYDLPRYVFVGPRGGDAPIHIGIFAGIHGDEPEGVHALVRLVQVLEARPELATGYCLSLYPVCNPTGIEDDTRFSRRGKDLNREFWSHSEEPEVRLLEAELTARAFNGIIALHTDDTCGGFYGIVRGATLTRHLIEPALRAADQVLPRDLRPVIDGFAARNGILLKTFSGILSAPPRVRLRPFEIILETPAAAPEYVKEGAFVAALQAILHEYRQFIAYAPNL